MDTKEMNAISDSLFNRHVFYVCLTSQENSENFHGDLFQMRKSFFDGGMKRFSTAHYTDDLGLDGKVRGKINSHSIKWKKTLGKTTIEESFFANGSYVIVRRDLNGSICGKITYDKNMLWTKTEYFNSDDYMQASIILKPVGTNDSVEKFIYDPAKKRYDSQLLYPVAYMHGSAEQSVIDAKNGDNYVLVATDRGEFCYCPEDETNKRSQSIDDINSGTIMMMPAWEIKDGEIPETAIGPSEVEAEPEAENAEKAIPEASVQEAVSEAEPVESAGIITETDLSLNIESTQETPPVKTQIIAAGEEYNYTGKMLDGKREGRGRTDQQNGLTAFDGEYIDNKKDGFGASYCKNGDMSYVGGWKEDCKDGIGVSFRKDDHAVHIAKWNMGKPDTHTTLIDSDGNLKFSGRIVDGKKQGAGISYRKADDTVLVGKYTDGCADSYASLFDSDGCLIYTGQWKDGKRNGTGTEFDKNGQIVYSGEWKDDKYLNGILYQKI